MNSFATLGVQLADPPSDGVSNLRFSASSDLLLVSSWDGTVRLYDTARTQLKQCVAQTAPILDATLEHDAGCFSTGLDSNIKKIDLATGSEQLIGTHDQPGRCVEWLSEKQLVVSGSWDRSLRVWDPRSPTGHNCVVLIPLPGKVFSMSQSGSMLTVATSERQNLAFDLRRIENGKPEFQRESSLKFQTRCLRCFPNGKGFAISSTEGRVAIEYYDESEAAQAKKFAFKCHRGRNNAGEDVAYPINAMAFHPLLGTFATGGCDGVFSMWDPENKKRLFQVTGYPTSIAALSFNHDGTQLAIAASYTYERGEQSHPADAVYIRQMQETEVKPKPRK